MRRIKAAGIYIIEIGDWYYIGKSIDIFSRWQSHYTQLKLGTHHSPKLQQLFNEKGLTGITFRVLEYISITEFKKVSQIKGKELNRHFNKHLLLKEKEWMKKYSINWCLNKDNKHFS